MSGERVLLVDDEEDFVAVLKERLEMRGLQVWTAGTGERAIELASERSFDAIVLDLRMPGLDGIATLRELLRKDSDAQVIVLTGHGTVSTSVEAMRAGAADFMEKPPVLADLVGKIGDAATNRTILLEERSAERVEQLLKTRGW